MVVTLICPPQMALCVLDHFSLSNMRPAESPSTWRHNAAGTIPTTNPLERLNVPVKQRRTTGRSLRDFTLDRMLLVLNGTTTKVQYFDVGDTLRMGHRRSCNWELRGVEKHASSLLLLRTLLRKNKGSFSILCYVLVEIE